MLYVYTRNGYALSVATTDKAAAIQAVQAQPRYGAVMEVQTQAEWSARNAPDPNRCRRCDELRAICGGWCVLTAADCH